MTPISISYGHDENSYIIEQVKDFLEEQGYDVCNYFIRQKSYGYELYEALYIITFDS